MEIQYSRKTILFSLFLSLLLLAGCSNTLFQSSGKSTANTPEEYLKLAHRAPPLLAIEYKLKAALLYIQSNEASEAQQVIRNIQLDMEMPDDIKPTLRKLILDARFALIKKDFNAASALIREALSILAPYTRNETARSTGNPQRMALLLPSSGPHAVAAKSIRDGFLAAFYQSGQSKNQDAGVKIYDTGNGGNIREAYQKAMDENAGFIVGPLTKPEVQVIATMPLTVPVLALNTISEDRSLPRELYQFGLMPEDEVVAVAEQALKQGYKQALILAPQSEWGQRLSRAFKKYWTAHGGWVRDTRYFKSNQDIDEKIKTLHPTKGEMIFLAATPETARMIMPLLNASAEGVPVFATASVYSGTPLPSKDNSLNGVHFCDMPWVLQHSQHIQEAHVSLEKLWPQSAARSPRFFALGLDAYQLASKIGTSRGVSSQRISGYTGDLEVNSYHRVQRGLVCAKFEHGVPVPD